MKVGEETNFGRLATIFQICSMDADSLKSYKINKKTQNSLRPIVNTWKPSKRQIYHGGCSLIR